MKSYHTYTYTHAHSPDTNRRATTYVGPSTKSVHRHGSFFIGGGRSLFCGLHCGGGGDGGGGKRKKASGKGTAGRSSNTAWDPVRIDSLLAFAPCCPSCLVSSCLLNKVPRRLLCGGLTMKCHITCLVVGFLFLPVCLLLLSILCLCLLYMWCPLCGVYRIVS